MIEIIKNNKDIFEATNGVSSLIFYKNGENRGKYEIKFKNNELTECIIKDCYSAINIYSPNKKKLIETASDNFDYKNQTEKIDNLLGKGLMVIFIPFNNQDQNVSFKIQFKIYETQNFILVKIIDIIDHNSNQLAVHSISPLTIRNSTLWLSGGNTPTNLHNITWFKNGWQTWSRSKTLFGDEHDTKGPGRDIFNMVYDNQDYEIEGRFYSEYCTVITDLNSENSLILGFTTLKDQFTRIIFDYENDLDLKMLTAIGCMDGISLNDSSITSSEELFICFKTKNSGYYGLIDYAKVICKYKGEERVKSIPIGWCSWYYYFTKITQDAMIRNLDFFKNNKKDLPIDLIQLDDGYFKTIGDYKDINSKFPNGLAWLFEEIKNGGFETGIWTAPFFGVRKSELFQNHREWFLKKSGKILKTHFSVDWKSFLYSLDLSNREVLEYLRTFFTHLLFAFEENQVKNSEHLINYFKIDFLHAAVPFGADYNNKNFTRAQLYYNGIKTIRDAITDKSFLLGCGAPLGPCVGLVDAMRISEDTAPFWEVLDNSEDLKDVPQPALKEALLNILYRSFMHKYFWINDPDCLMIRRTDTKLNLDEIKLQLTIFGLSGGQVLISDDMTKLSQEEINDAKLLIPPYNPKEFDPIVVDAFISKFPSIYMLETKEIIGKRYLVAIINWNDNTTSKNIKISELISVLSNEDNEFYIYDFWNEKFLGEFKSTDYIELMDIQPHSCRYLNIIPIKENTKEVPTLISTNLHITQGCCEIKHFEYNIEINQLNIDLDLKGIRKGFLLLKLPPDKKITKTNFGFSKINSKENLWKIFVQFKDFLSLIINLN